MEKQIGGGLLFVCLIKIWMEFIIEDDMLEEQHCKKRGFKVKLF